MPMVEKIAKASYDTFYVLFRIVAGIMFAVHGAQKFGLFGGPGLEGFAGFAQVSIGVAAVIASIETLGGLLVALGLFTRIASAISGVFILLVYVIAHVVGKGSLLPWSNGGELALLYAVVFLFIFTHGTHKIGLDKLLKKSA